MANPVNDPALLARLNGGGNPVSDPALLSRLNGPSQQRQDANAYAGEDVGGMGTIMRGLGGAKHALDKAAMGIKGMLPQSVQDAGDAVDRFFNAGGLNEDLVKKGEAFVNEGGTAAKVGQLGADIAMTAAPVAKGTVAAGNLLRMLPNAGKYLAAGNILPSAIAGGATAAALDPTDRTGAAIGGAVGGGFGELAGRAITKVGGGLFRGKNMSQDAADLIREGVDVPIWKTSDSGVLRGLVERAKGFPVAGDILRKAEGRAMQDVELKLMNKANPMQPVLDDNGNIVKWVAGKPIKETGEEGIGKLHQAFNNAYDTMYKGRSVPVDQQYSKAMADILRQAEAYHPGYHADLSGAGRQIDDLLRAGTESTFTKSPIVNAAGKPFVNEELGHAAVSTNNVKSALDTVRGRIETAIRSGEVDKANILKQMEGELLDLRARGLPQEVANIGKDVDKAYATYKQLQRANTTIGSKGNGFSSPSQILGSIKALDRTPGKSAFAEGKALNQDFIQKAKNVLGDRLPDVGPGTAEKLMMGVGLGLPFLGQDYAVATPAALLLSTKTGRKALIGGMKGQETIRNIGSKYLTPALRSYGVANTMGD